MDQYTPFLLPITISYEQQLEIIESAKNHEPKKFTIQLENGDELVRDRANDKVITEPHRFITEDTQHLAVPLISAHKDHCINRFNKNIKWEWRRKKTSQMIKNLLEPLSGIIQFTRVFTLVRRPGEPAITHADVAYDHSYSTGWTSKPELHGNNPEHHHNNYAAIRIPLSEKDGDNGLPYLYIDDQPYYYNAGKNLFVIDEIRNPHGADPIDFYRGVVFVDGFVDFEKLQALKSGEIAMTPREIHDWDGDMSRNFDIVFN